MWKTHGHADADRRAARLCWKSSRKSSPNSVRRTSNRWRALHRISAASANRGMLRTPRSFNVANSFGECSITIVQQPECPDGDSRTTRAFPVHQEETVVLGALRVTLQARDQTARLQPASQLGRFRSRALMTDARSVLNTLLGQASTRPKNRLPERRSDRLLINAYRSASVGCSFSLSLC